MGRERGRAFLGHGVPVCVLFSSFSSFHLIPDTFVATGAGIRLARLGCQRAAASRAADPNAARTEEVHMRMRMGSCSLVVIRDDGMGRSCMTTRGLAIGSGIFQRE